MHWSKPTGFPRGRPRKGEIRPVTPGGLASAKWREENYELYLKRNREYSVKWRAKNPERAREIGQSYRNRARLWKNDVVAHAIADHVARLNMELHNGS
jgi:hypothetical protein